MVYLSQSELAEALAASEAVESGANALVKEQLTAAGEDIDEVELDMSGPGWQFLFQDIVRRSKTISTVTVQAAFTCSKMRSDGFGGMAMLITADAVMAKSTGELLDEFAAQAEGRPNPGGDHVLVVLRYSAIRNLIAGFVDRDPACTIIPASEVTAADVADAIREAIGADSFSAMQTELEGHIAARAIRIAEKRLAAAGGPNPSGETA